VAINIIRKGKGWKKVRRLLQRIEGKIDTMSLTTDKELADIEIIKTNIQNNSTALVAAQKALADSQAVVAELTSQEALDQQKIDELTAAAAASAAAAQAAAAQVETDNAPVLAALDALAGTTPPVTDPAQAPTDTAPIA